MFYTATITEKGNAETIETGDCLEGEHTAWITKAQVMAEKTGKTYIVSFKPREQSFEVYPSTEIDPISRATNMIRQAGKEFKEQLIVGYPKTAEAPSGICEIVK